VSLTGGAGEMKPEGMITKLIKMDEVAEQGFKALIEDKDNQVKILVDVGAKLWGYRHMPLIQSHIAGYRMARREAEWWLGM